MSSSSSSAVWSLVLHSLRVLCALGVVLLLVAACWLTVWHTTLKHIPFFNEIWGGAADKNHHPPMRNNTPRTTTHTPPSSLRSPPPPSPSLLQRPSTSRPSHAPTTPPH